jgi:hypothetical protein
MGFGPFGATRNEPFEAFSDIVTRKNPRGYVRSILAVKQKLNTAAEVDAAYAKFISASNESAVLDAARKMAVDRPHRITRATLKRSPAW